MTGPTKEETDQTTRRMQRIAVTVDECSKILEELSVRHPEVGREAQALLAAAAVISLSLWDLQDSLDSDLSNVANTIENTR